MVWVSDFTYLPAECLAWAIKLVRVSWRTCLSAMLVWWTLQNLTWPIGIYRWPCAERSICTHAPHEPGKTWPKERRCPIRMESKWDFVNGTFRYEPTSFCSLRYGDDVWTLENAPTALHVYAFPAPSEPFNPCLRSVILHNQTVVYAQWNPVQPGSLLLCCGTRAVYTWTSNWRDAENNYIEMAECVGIPTG